MSHLSRSALVPYSAAEMFALVADIDGYENFLPWCGGSRVLSVDGQQVVAEVEINFKGVQGICDRKHQCAG